jgi:hypothetical protein
MRFSFDDVDDIASFSENERAVGTSGRFSLSSAAATPWPN